jgi:hypothetical protein
LADRDENSSDAGYLPGFIFHRLALVLAVPLLIAGVLFCADSTHANENDLLGDRFTYFYKNPDIDGIPGLLRDLGNSEVRKGRSVWPPSIGFFAALFERNPEQVDAWVAGEFPFQLQWVIGSGLSLAGMRGKALEFAKRHDWPKQQMDLLRRQPTSLMTMPVASASDLDILWGASFVTGEAKFPGRMIDMVASALGEKGISVAHLLRIARGPGNPPKNPEWLEKYSRKQAIVLLVSGAALWALGSNAKQHEFVAEAVRGRISTEPDSDLSYALRKSWFRQGADVVSRVPGKSVSVILSTMPTLDSWENVEKPISIEAYMRDFKNEFAIGEPVFIAVLAIVAGGAASEYSLQVIPPNSGPFAMGPYRVGRKAKAQLAGNALLIDKGKLITEGVYEIVGTFGDGDSGKLRISQKFFVGDR